MTNKEILKIALAQSAVITSYSIHYTKLYEGLTVLFVYFAKDNLVGLWDELRLWGAYTKALHTSNSLQLGSDAFIYPIMQSYPPAMPLLGYFV